MMEGDCRGGNLLGKFVSYLHNYLGAPADAEAEIFWALIYSKRLVFAQGLCTGTQLVNQAYV